MLLEQISIPIPIKKNSIPIPIQFRNWKWNWNWPSIPIPELNWPHVCELPNVSIMIMKGLHLCLAIMLSSCLRALCSLEVMKRPQHPQDNYLHTKCFRIHKMTIYGESLDARIYRLYSQIPTCPEVLLFKLNTFPGLLYFIQWLY